MDWFADEVAALMDDVGIERAVLGGLSIGGYVAFSFLRRHKERVSALILADTRAGADTPEVGQRRMSQQRQVAEEGTAPLIEAMVSALLSDYTRSQRPHVVERARSLMDNSPAGMIGALDAMRRRSDSTGELEAIDVPTLVIVGQHDQGSPPNVAAEMAERIPDGRLVQLRTAGHLSNLEVPDDFNRAVRRFLDWQRAS
jgi:pimeloyl-ACP methyl ester carboxylesterase